MDLLDSNTTAGLQLFTNKSIVFKVKYFRQDRLVNVHIGLVHSNELY